MPELTKVLSEEDLARHGGMPRLDLATYVSLIDRVRNEQGVGGIVTLGPGEGQRTEKRRLSLAAKQQGYKLTWRRSDPGQLRFVLAQEGQRAPGGRQRRTPADEQVEQLVADAVMTDDVAAVTEATATAATDAAPAPPARNGRRRRRQE